MSARAIAFFVLAIAVAPPAFAADCGLLSTVCAEGPETRTVDGEPVNRDCWRYESRYECLAADPTPEPYCAELETNGCYQTDSTCEQTTGTTCVSYAQTYACPVGPPTTETVLDCGSQTYCADGTCFNTAKEENNNFAKNGAQLLAVTTGLSEALKIDQFELFKGQDMRCSKSILNYYNCCKDSGWGVGTGLTDCTPEEEALGLQKEAGRCHYIGSYCSNDTLLGCTARKQTYCCYGSKLIRIIAEQGKPQLGKGWGMAEAPDCTGFTPDEVVALDFSAMDLSEFYADVANRIPVVDQAALEQRLQDKMDQLQNQQK